MAVTSLYNNAGGNKLPVKFLQLDSCLAELSRGQAR